MKTADIEQGVLYVISPSGAVGYVLDPARHYSATDHGQPVWMPNDSGKGTHILALAFQAEGQVNLSAENYTVMDYRHGVPAPEGFEVIVISPQSVFGPYAKFMDAWLNEATTKDYQDQKARGNAIRAGLAKRGIEPVSVSYDHVVLTHDQMDELLA